MEKDLATHFQTSFWTNLGLRLWVDIFSGFQFFSGVFLRPSMTDGGMTPPPIVILKSLIEHSFKLCERLSLVNQRIRLHFHPTPQRFNPRILRWPRLAGQLGGLFKVYSDCHSYRQNLLG